MIKFNRLGKVLATNLNTNPFYVGMPQTRQILVKRAFGLIPEKSPVIRRERQYDAKDGWVSKKDGFTINYQEPLQESRQHVQGMLEMLALYTGTTLSQATHGFVSGNMEAFAAVVYRRIQATIHQVESKKWDTGLGDWVPTTHFEFGLPDGHKFKGNPKAITNEEVLQTVYKVWNSIADIQTKQEEALEGVEGAIQKLETEKKAKQRSWNTSKKNSMKGVQVVNAKQQARQAAKIGA